MSLNNPILQHRRTACGLAALIMIDHHFGGQTTAIEFEAMHGCTQQQWSAADLIQNATRLGLAVQALELEPAELPALPLPCILHWQLNHFVVLRAMGWGRYVVDDPALGRLTIDQQTLLDQFTGVALTCRPVITERAKSTSGQASASSPQDVNLQVNQLTALVFCLIVGILQAGIPLIIKFILDDVVISQDLALLQSITTGLLLILLTMPLMTHLQERFLLGSSQRLEHNAFTRLLNNQIAAASSSFEAIDVQATLKRVKLLHAFGQFYGAEAVRFLGDLLLAVGLLGTLWLIHPASALLMTVMAAVLIGTSLWFTQPILSAEKYASNSEQTRLEHLMEWLSHRQAIRRYGAEQPFLNRIIQALNATHSHQLQTSDRKAQMTLANQITIGIALSLLLYGIASEAMIGRMSLGGLYLILAYRGLLTQHVLSMCQQLTSARSAKDIRHDLRGITPPTQLTERTDLTLKDSTMPQAQANPSTQTGALRYLRLSPSTSFSAVRDAILDLPSTPVQNDRIDQPNRPFPIATATPTDPILNTTILANITMMAVMPDLARVDRLIQLMALTHSIYRHPLGLDTIIAQDQHGFDRFEHARFMLTRALYTQPRCVVYELPAVFASCSVMQEALGCLVRKGLTIELRSHDPILPFQGLSLVSQSEQGWLQKTELI